MTVFTWDQSKEIENILKHGVDFHTAILAFEDPYRRITHDLKHSAEENRFFGVGEAAAGVLTVRFTYRENEIRIIGAGYWRKGKNFMKKRKKIDPDMPIGKLIEVPDFLPPPSELAKAKTIVTVTIGLDLKTIDFFKAEAEKHGRKYQRMIREVLDRYADHYQKKSA